MCTPLCVLTVTPAHKVFIASYRQVAFGTGDLMVYFWLLRTSSPSLPVLGAMQFSGRKKKVNLIPQSELYGHNVQFYAQPPVENISLNEFETFAVERLKCEALKCQSTDFRFTPLLLYRSSHKVLTPMFASAMFIFGIVAFLVCSGQFLWLFLPLVIIGFEGDIKSVYFIEKKKHNFCNSCCSVEDRRDFRSELRETIRTIQKETWERVQKSELPLQIRKCEYL